MDLLWNQYGAWEATARERRIAWLNAKEAEDVLERVSAPQPIRVQTADSNARTLYQKMAAEMANVGVLTKINHFFSGKRADNATMQRFLDREAEREIQQRTDQAVSWIGGIVKRKKYREYLGLKNAVKERIRSEMENYVQGRAAKLETLRTAASVSARLRSRKDRLVPMEKHVQRMTSALARAKDTLQKKQQRDQQRGRQMPTAWAEAMQSEELLKTTLLKFHVVAPQVLESMLDDNEQGGKLLITAIEGSAFHDPDDPEAGAMEKQLCQKIATNLRKFRGYRAYRLTERTNNELPTDQKLKALGQKANPVGTEVQVVINNMKLRAYVLTRDAAFPEALILRGPGASLYILDTNEQRLTYMDGPKKRHLPLTERNFSILQN